MLRDHIQCLRPAGWGLSAGLGDYGWRCWLHIGPALVLIGRYTPAMETTHAR